MSVQTHTIADSKEMKELAHSIEYRVGEHAEVSAFWIFDDNVEVHVPIESGGVWDSDIPEGYRISEVKADNGELIVTVR